MKQDPKFPALASAMVASGLPCDPATHPLSLSVGPRTLPSTARALEVIRQAFGFTFAGEAAALCLTYAALHPAKMDLDGLREVPRCLVAKSDSRAPTINTPLPEIVLNWLQTEFTGENLTCSKIAAAILHKNAPALAASLGGGL